MTESEYTEKHLNLNIGIVAERHIELRKKSVLWLDSGVNESTFSNFVRDLLYTKLCLVKEKILIILNSPGGDPAHGFGIFDTIQAMRKAGMIIDILGIGEVASMAAAIMQAGTRRLALPHTQFLLHQASDFPKSEREEVNQKKENAEELQRISKIYLEIIAENAGISFDVLFKMTKKTDYWIDAYQAKTLGTKGLIDEVVEEIPFP